MTKINIITATYNSEETLPDLIESLESQTDLDFSWYVADGGSSDNTIELLNSVSKFKVIVDSQPDFGIYDAINRALRSCKGEYYLVVGSDDRLCPNAVEYYRAAADSTSAPFIAANIISNGRELKPRGGHILISRQMKFISGHSVGTLIKKEMHEKHGYYSKRFPIAADQLFLEKAFLAGEEFFHLDKPVGVFGSNGVSSTDKLGSYTESFRIHSELLGMTFINLMILVVTIIKNYKRI